LSNRTKKLLRGGKTMKKLETDIVVVGAGTAGLAAAIAAAEKNAKVIIFEKASTTGGTGNMGMGPFAVESRLQRKKNVLLTREEAFKIFMDFTHWRVDARLVSNYLNKSASTIEWLEEMGVEFADVISYFRGSYTTHHIVKPPGRSPGPMATAAMMKCMTDRAHELGVKFFLKTPVKKILKEKDRIVGVIAEDRDGETIQANAKAVIIATGGFGDNPEMIKKYTPYEWGRNIFSTRIPGIAGEGIRMAWEAGAAEEGMNMELVCGLAGMMGGSTTPKSMAARMQLMEVNFAFSQPNLYVNLLGERFMNEEIAGASTFVANAIARQKNSCAFSIFDEATKNQFVNESLDFLMAVFPITKVENFDAILEQLLDKGSDIVFTADSLEELASKTKINADTLKKTVEEYNETCHTGRDEIFHKSPKYLRPVKKPKFYAGKLAPSAYGSLGGIKINHRTEVVTKDFEPILGLYAAGTDACSIYADSYVFVLCGNTMGFALNSGRLAAENAAEYIKSIK
jgi:fumarate reductase flavoprotein subunit